MHTFYCLFTNKTSWLFNKMSTDNDKIELILDDQNKAVIYMHGATITSWSSKGQEVLFVSKKSVFDNKKAIRGGIPVVFPNFGPWSDGRPQHGFARIKRWSVKNGPSRLDDESVSMSVTLSDDAETHALWPHQFELVYVVTLRKDSLKTSLTINNTGPVEFDFTCLLHTYFLVDDVANVRIANLKGVKYTDKVLKTSDELESRDVVNIDQEVDRVYVSTPSGQTLTAGGNVTRRVEKENMPDTVVWNPWSEKAKAMADFDDEEYKTMVCIEPGYVNERYVLKAGQSVTMGQLIYS